MSFDISSQVTDNVPYCEIKNKLFVCRNTVYLYVFYRTVWLIMCFYTYADIFQINRKMLAYETEYTKLTV